MTEPTPSAMTAATKLWLVADVDTYTRQYWHSFSGFFNLTSWGSYDFFFKEIYDFEFSPTKCIYEARGATLSPGDTVLDLGANIGLFSLYAAGFGGQIYAIEGGTTLFSCLVYNTLPAGNVHCVNTNISVPDTPTHSWGSATLLNTSLEELFTLYDIPHIDFCKIDIEGSEFDLLTQTPRHVLDKIDKLAIEWHFAGEEGEYKLAKLCEALSPRSLFWFDWYLNNGNSVQRTLYFYNP
jgi:FkbM family methyltransferase